MEIKSTTYMSEPEKDRTIKKNKLCQNKTNLIININQYLYYQILVTYVGIFLIGIF